MNEFKLQDLIGDYDNFRQYWKENTDEDKHRDKVEVKHRHLHLKIKPTDQDNRLEVTYYTGRNNKEYIDTEYWRVTFSDSGINVAIDNHSVGQSLEYSEEGLIFKLSHRDDEEANMPYHFLKCRYFSGFIEYALTDDHEEYHRVGDLTIHDQGGMAELVYEGKYYTVELTQLVFAHVIFLMKVAIYNMPLGEVDINSKAISYAWSDPSSKRLGINIRKIISGWTFIEEGFLSSNTLEQEE